MGIDRRQFLSASVAAVATSGTNFQAVLDALIERPGILQISTGTATELRGLLSKLQAIPDFEGVLAYVDRMPVEWHVQYKTDPGPERKTVDGLRPTLVEVRVESDRPLIEGTLAALRRIT
ncbi:MAG: hypothetical protein AAGC81_01785 [Pseudomonadota bacterium]